jgi:ATP-dependent DNA ligase
MFETSELYPGVQIPTPQLVGKNPFDNIGELSYKKGWLASIKKDGYYEMLVKENNQVYMFARSKSKKTGFYTEKIGHVPFLKEWAQETLPNGTVLIGEVYLPQGTSKDVTTILGCLEEKAIDRQNLGGNLHYYVHDIVKYNGYDYIVNEDPYMKRYSDLCQYIDLCSSVIPEVEVAAVYDSIYTDFNSLLEELFAENEEGLVFKNENGLYLPGKRRPKEMFKVKQEVDNIDVVVLECLDPEKVYTGKELETWPYWEDSVPVTKPYALGWKNAFLIGAYNERGVLERIGSVASGLDDTLRAEMGKNPQSFVGQVVELQAMSVDKENHTIRHPAFVRTRPDKNPQECTLKDIFN